MDHLDWKTLAVVIGAVTGPLSLWMQVVSKRPRIRWAPLVGALDGIKVHVDNPSLAPLGISRVQIIGTRPVIYALHKDAKSEIEYSGEEWHETLKTGRLNVFIEPNGSREIVVRQLKPDHRSVLILWWHRYWLLPIRLPYLMWLSLDVVRHVNRGGA